MNCTQRNMVNKRKHLTQQTNPNGSLTFPAMISTKMKKNWKRNELLNNSHNNSSCRPIVAKKETVLAGMPTEEADTIRADLSSIIRRTQAPKPNCTRNQIAAMKTLQQNDNIIILPADKGRATVILNKEDYIRKCKENLENGPTSR